MSYRDAGFATCPGTLPRRTLLLLEETSGYAAMIEATAR